MNNIEYWKGRTEQKVLEQYAKAEVLEKQLKENYELASEEINKKITYFYQKYAKDNEMSYQEAIMFLRGKEFNRWRKTLEGYVHQIMATDDELLQLELNTLAMKSRIRRLDKLKVDIDIELHNLYKNQNTKVTELLNRVANDTYYKTVYQIQMFEGIGHSFAKLDPKTINSIIKYPWSGANYSDRIWKQKEHLADTIKQELTQKFIQGKSVNDVAISISKKMNVSYKNACRLVETETSYISGQATLKGYKATGIEEYQMLATLDRHTCDICRKLDGKVFNVNDMTIGVNYPPLHPRDRCTTVPYFDDDIGERIAKDSKGKNYFIDSKMTYDEWNKQYVI